MDIEELQAKLRAAEQQVQRLEELKQRAEEETRKTTLLEFIDLCHEMYEALTVETDRTITSKGSITNPAGRRCPTRLEPWNDFLNEQRFILGQVFSKFPAEARFFKSRHYLRERGQVIAGRRVGDEDTLKYVLHDLVPGPVGSIVERLRDVDIGFDIGGGITFETRVNALSAEQPTTPDGRKLRPDEISAYRDDGDSRKMAYVIEHKAPHKLTPQHLRLGLRPMDIYKDVVNRATMPARADEAAMFEYHADRLAAAAVTQTFDYMIQAGLTYSYLTTGEAIVFLKIDWADMTLYYHLAEPGPEVIEHRDNRRCCTAVSQVLAFTILALDSPEHHGQDDRQRAMGLKKWAEDWESILRSIPLSERVAPPISPACKPRTYKGIDRSPYLLRTRAMTRDPRGNSSDGGSSRDGGATSRRYCSQKCLLGLVTAGDLDEGCPNVALHRGEDNDRRHPVDHTTWLRLLREQLRQTLDDGLVRLGKQGARGIIFQVTLLRHSYTFIGKGTTATFTRELEHEANVYRRLRPVQGVRVPVFLGAVDLGKVGRTYYYETQADVVHIVHFMLLSWSGSSLGEVEVSGAEIEREVMGSVRELHAHGVAHTDVRGANVLWDDRTGRVMVIDFEQAVLTERPRPGVAAIVPNKRRRIEDVDGDAGKRKLKGDVWFRMWTEDVLAAKMIFR